MNRVWLIELLKLLKAEVPPPDGCNHGIRYAQYGSDESGWRDEIALDVRVVGGSRILFLDASDFEMAPEALVQGIISSMKAIEKAEAEISCGEKTA